MKKITFPLAFAILLGLTTQHALCMHEKEDLENSKTLAKLETLKIARKKETEIQTRLSIKQPTRFDCKNGTFRPIYGRGPIIDGDDTYKHLCESNDRLSNIVSEIEKIEKALEMK